MRRRKKYNKKAPEGGASTVAQRGSAGKERHTHHQAPEGGASIVAQCASAGNKRIDPIACAIGFRIKNRRITDQYVHGYWMLILIHCCFGQQ